MIVINIGELIGLGLLAVCLLCLLGIAIINGIAGMIQNRQQKKIDEAFKDEEEE